MVKLKYLKTMSSKNEKTGYTIVISRCVEGGKGGYMILDTVHVSTRKAAYEVMCRIKVGCTDGVLGSYRAFSARLGIVGSYDVYPLPYVVSVYQNKTIENFSLMLEVRGLLIMDPPAMFL